MSTAAAHDDLAFVFPGQGSQSVGMLADLAAQYPDVADTFAEASEGAGVDLWKIASAGPAEILDSTENTQPALLAASVALWRVWARAGGPPPAWLAGHSLGEYSALVCAQVLSLHDGAALVAERGRLMQAAVPAGEGAMAAVIGSDDAVVADVCRTVAGNEIVAPANYNSPGQVVIAGHAGAVDRALHELQGMGARKTVKLAVSVPSHTSLMRGAAEQLGERMQAMRWHAPALPVVQNVDARAHDDPDDIREALQRQLFMPVRWTDCVQYLVAQGVTRLAECGPGKALTGLARRIDRSLDARALGTLAGFGAALTAWG